MHFTDRARTCPANNEPALITHRDTRSRKSATRIATNPAAKMLSADRPDNCTESGNLEDPNTRRVLRSLKTPETAIVPMEPPIAKMCMQLSKREAQLVEMATELGYAVTPVTNHLKEFAHSIAIRMINRTGENLYRSP